MKKIIALKCFKSFSIAPRVYKKPNRVKHKKKYIYIFKTQVYSFLCSLWMMMSFLSAICVISSSEPTKYWNKGISNLTGSCSFAVELHKLHYLGKAIIHMDSVFSHRTCQ